MYENFINNLPESFKKNVLAMPHFDGEKWLKSLPAIIRQIEEKWALKVEKHYPNLSYNYVAPCVLSDHREAVIKIGLPQEDSELFDEERALKLYNGKGAVKLLRAEKDLEILLLEKIKPGKSLKQVFEKEKSKAIDQNFTKTIDTTAERFRISDVG